METCVICNKEFHSYNSVKKHAGRAHKISSELYYTNTQLNGIPQVCKCGCGESTKWDGHKFKDYKVGHISRVKNNFNTDKSKLNSANTRRERFASGEITTWNKGLTADDARVRDNIDKVMSNPERGNNISIALTGKPKSVEHVKKITENHRKYWADQTHRDEQRLRRVEYFSTHLQNNTSKLEMYFMEMLDSLKIEYIHQYILDGYCYDFLIKDTKILIEVEVDGDWYHCNPSKFQPIHEIQKHTVEHDVVKNEVANKNRFTLLRFWEADINTDIAKVTKRLLDEIYKN